MATAHFESLDVTDWASFHMVSKEVFGFPDFYGMNMDAWIDCLSHLDEDDGMSRFYLDVTENVTIEVADSVDFEERLPEIFTAFCECVDFINQRYLDDGKPAKLVLNLQ